MAKKIKKNLVAAAKAAIKQAKEIKKIDAIISKAAKKLAVKDKAMLAAALKKGNAKLDALPMPNPHALREAAKRGTGAADLSWETADAALKRKDLYNVVTKSAASLESSHMVGSGPVQFFVSGEFDPPLPVESDKPGVPRVPKPKKVHQPLVSPAGGLGIESLAQLEIIGYHFMKLMERLASEHGGSNVKALEDLKADIASKK